MIKLGKFSIVGTCNKTTYRSHKILCPNNNYYQNNTSNVGRYYSKTFEKLLNWVPNAVRQMIGHHYYNTKMKMQQLTKFSIETL